MFGCGVEIGVGLWVCCGFCLGLPWVAWVRIGVGLGVVWRSALGCGFAMGYVVWIGVGDRCWAVDFCRWFFFWVINDRCSVWVISIRLWDCHGLREFRSA